MEKRKSVKTYSLCGMSSSGSPTVESDENNKIKRVIPNNMRRSILILSLSLCQSY